MLRDISSSLKQEQGRLRKLLQELKKPLPGRWLSDQPGWPSAHELAKQIEQVEGLIAENDKLLNTGSEST